MRFLFPAFLLGGLAVAIPIALHLLRRQAAPEVPFTAVSLLRRHPVPRSRHHRLRDLLLLAARVTVLLLLAAAFARPYVGGWTPDAGLVIVAVDRSYSMGGPDRFERAIALAREQIDGVPAHAQVALVAFDDEAEVVAGPGDGAAVRAALDALGAGYGGTAYAPLFARALELAGGGTATLSIIGDLQRWGWDRNAPVPVPSHLTVTVQDIGSPPQNAAVTHVRALDHGFAATVDVTHVEPFATTARLRVHGAVVAEAPVTIEGSSSAVVTFRHDPPMGAIIAIEIEDPAGLPADNVRYLVAGAASPGVVMVLGGEARQGAAYAVRALEAADAADAPAVRSVTPAGAARLSLDQWSEIAAVLLLSTHGLDRTARAALDQFVRRGGGLLISASDRTEAAVLGAMLDWPDFAVTAPPAAGARLAVTDLRHPIFQPFGGLTADLGDVRFTRVWNVRRDGWHTVARFTDGSPALLERAHGAGRVLLFASDLEMEWNDFPRQPSFVPFIVESIRHLARPVPSSNGYLVGHSPAGIGRQPGVYAVEDGGRHVAVNVDLRESSPVRLTQDEFLARLPGPGGAPVEALAATTAAQVESRQAYWRYGILLLMAMLVAESFIGRGP